MKFRGQGAANRRDPGGVKSDADVDTQIRPLQGRQRSNDNQPRRYALASEDKGVNNLSKRGHGWFSIQLLPELMPIVHPFPRIASGAIQIQALRASHQFQRARAPWI